MNHEITLDWLYARVKAVDGCLIWTGAVSSSSGNPQANAGGNARPVRLMLWELIHEKPMAKNMRAACGCGVKLCVHPEHITQQRNGAPLVGRKRPVTTRAKIARILREKSDLSEDAVREIRSSNTPLREVAAKHGMSASMACLIRRGKAWADYSSPFAGLCA
jgi:hypothetical protein